MVNIYQKYCNSIQNHALGALILVKFIEGFKKENASANPNLIHLFFTMPIIMIEDIRVCIKPIIGQGGVTTIDRFISEKVKGKNSKFSILSKRIESFKNYTITSLIFGLKTELLTINDKSEVELKNSIKVEYDTDKMLTAAYKLGSLFGKDNFSLQKLIAASGVILE